MDTPRIDQLRRRVSADPASIAFAALAEEYRKEGRYPEAIETCRLGLQRHPAYLSARVTLGRALIGVGDYEAARLELEAVLRVAPENLAAIRAMAEIYSRFRDSEEMPAAVADAPLEDTTLPPHEETCAQEPVRGPAAQPPPGPQLPPLRLASVEPRRRNEAAIERLGHFLRAITEARARLSRPPVPSPAE